MKLERIKGQVEDAAKRIDFVLTESDWESSDEPGVPDYPASTAVEELIEEYQDVVHEIDRLTDYFGRFGMKVG